MGPDEITALLMSDPIAGPELRKQANGQPFDSFAVNNRMQQLGVTLPQGMWISQGKVQHESKKVDNFGKAMLIGSGAAVGGFGAKAAFDHGTDQPTDYIGSDVGNSASSALGGGGSDWASILKKIALGVAPAAAGLTAHELSGGGGVNSTPANIPPELTQLLQMAMQRMTAQQPLVDAVNKQALGGLPDYVKRGG